MPRSVLARVPLFAGLPSSELDELASTLPQRWYPAGTLLFREGDSGDRFYIVLQGRIAVIKALGTAEERQLAMREAGEFVGEMSLLNRDGIRTASVRVEDDALLLEISRADFDALLHRQPSLVYEMLRVMSLRLGEAQNAAIHDLQEKNLRLEQAYAELQAAQAQLVEQEALRRELRLAREIQESMLPPALPRIAGVELGARMQAAREVGGDFWDVIPLDENRVGVVIGDVSGKGMPAALFMALTCSLLRAEARHGASPAAVLRSVNAHIGEMNARGMFVTVLYGLLDRTTMRFEYVRAGHDLPVLRASDGSTEVLPRGLGHPLGLLPRPMLDANAITLVPGSTLVLYTDGVTEATNAQGEFFGLEQLQQRLAQQPEASAQALCDSLVTLLTDYHTGVPQADDITVVAIRAV